MKRIWQPSLMTLALALQAAAQPTSITPIDYPGATGTQAWGINPRGDIVGLYTTADKLTHGFLLRDGKYTAIDYPGAPITLLNSINAQGDVVGEYGLTTIAPHRGFLLSGGAYTAIDYPGASSTAPTGINTRGDIVGLYVSAGATHGFLLSGGTYTTIDYPNATTTLAQAINSSGEIVGGYAAAGVSHAFRWSGGRFTSYDYPGANGFTNAVGISAAGDIVGRYRGADNASHGYLLSNGTFTTVDIPGATFTGLTGINPAGDIVGRQTTAGVNHGFLMTQKSGRYRITDLGPMGLVGQPFFIADSGVGSGTTTMSDGAAHGFVWSKGVFTDLGSLGAGISNSWAYVVNEKGQAVGMSETLRTDPYYEDFCGFKALGFPTWGKACVPVIWQNGVAAVLPMMGNNAFASWINNRGDVAGAAENTTVDPGCHSPQRFQFKPVLWLNGQLQELPTATGDPDGVVNALNDAGQAVGGSGTCADFSPQLLNKLQSLHALLWQNGKAIDLGNLGGSGHGMGNFALGINQQGQVVGNSDLPGDAATHAFLWTKEDGMRDLGTLPGDVNSGGVAINDRGEVVGVSLDASFNLKAYHWANGKMEKLNDLVVGETSLALMLACSINSRGEIVGLAFDTNTNEFHGFLATPTGEGSGAAERPELTQAQRRTIQRQLSYWRMGPGMRILR